MVNNKDDYPPAPPDADTLVFHGDEWERVQALVDRPIEEWVEEAKKIFERYQAILDYSKELPSYEFLIEGLNVINTFFDDLKDAQNIIWNVGRSELLNRIYCAKGEMMALKIKLDKQRACDALEHFDFFGYPYD